ncbi:MAG: TraX family protein [Lachnospiraceae bacterium]|nr:TraX family protein [Lachnospiraceae bacterium]
MSKNKQKGIKGSSGRDTDRSWTLSRSQIKWLALLLMTCNHFSEIFLKGNGVGYELLRGLGYFTAPVMCYLLVYSYQYTSSVKRYALRLLGFALLSQGAFNLALAGGFRRFIGLNMFFSLLLGVLILHLKYYLAPGALQTLLLAGCFFLSVFCDWPLLAPAMVWVFDRQREGRLSEGKTWFFVMGSFLILFWGAENTAGRSPLELALSCVLALSGIVLAWWIITRHYDPKKEQLARLPNARWTFYVYYPLHLLVLAGLHRLVG